MKLLAEKSEKYEGCANLYNEQNTKVGCIQADDPEVLEEIMARINGPHDITPGEWLEIKDSAKTIARLLT